MCVMIMDVNNIGVLHNQNVIEYIQQNPNIAYGEIESVFEIKIFLQLNKIEFE